MQGFRNIERTTKSPKIKTKAMRRKSSLRDHRKQQGFLDFIECVTLMVIFTVAMLAMVSIAKSNAKVLCIGDVATITSRKALVAVQDINGNPVSCEQYEKDTGEDIL